MRSVCLILGLFSAALSSTSHAIELNLQVFGVQRADSTIYAALYDQPQGFPGKGRPLALAKNKSNGDTAMVSFRALPPGQYAIAVYEDVDGNGKLNRNLFGAPTEPFGLSNNVRPRGGPPSFRQAAFELKNDDPLTIELK